MKRALTIITLLTLWVCITSLLPPSRYTPPPLLDSQSLAALTAPWSARPAQGKPDDDTEPPPDSSALAAQLSAPPEQAGAAKPKSDSWQGFIGKLRALERGERDAVRIIHLGDSELVADGTSRAARRQLANRFGLHALGFSAPMLPLPWYEREHWRHHEGKGVVKVWAFPYGKLIGGHYGPGGVAFGLSAGSRAHVELSHPVMGSCTIRFYYAQEPGGGEILLSADGQPLGHIDSDGPQMLAYWQGHRYSCPDKLALSTARAHTLSYGWHISYDVPGIEWSSLGVVAARLRHLRHYDDNHLAQSLRVMQPDLVVLTYGLNVAAEPQPPAPAYEQDAAEAFLQIRRLLPTAACLVTGPYPFGSPDPLTGPRVEPARAVSAYQKAAAQTAGCTYLDRFNLAGGAKAAYRWGTARPKVLAGDYQHLTIEGGDRMGEAIAQVILDAVDSRDPSLTHRYFRLER